MSENPTLIATSASVQRVREALAAAGIVAAVVELPGAAHTARLAAAALGCDVARIANSLVFRNEASNEPVLVMTSGANRVDAVRVAAVLGAPIGKADAAFVRAATGFAIGGVAPVGHIAPIRTLIDRTLLGHEEIWAAAGHPHTVFRLMPAELVAVTGGTVCDVAAR